MEEIFTRRSIRKFLDRPVEPEKLDRILRAGMQAPSAGNQQPWEFILVQERAALKKLSKMSPYSGPAAGSAVTLVMLGNLEGLRFPAAWLQDMGAAAQNILLEAVHLGLGGVWMEAADESRAAFLRNMFQIPQNVHPFALIAIGYPDGQENRFVNRYKPQKVHHEQY